VSLKRRLVEDMKSAMKAGAKVRLSTIRMVNAAVKNSEIEVGHELEDAGVEEVIARAVKQRRDSIEQYRRGGREDLADREQSEIDVLTEYLPEQLGEQAIRQMAQEAIAEAGASSVKEMGAVMKRLMPKVRGRAEGAAVTRIVKELLGA